MANKKFLISEGRSWVGQKCVFHISEVSYNRVSYMRVFVSNHKEQLRQGLFFSFLISEFSHKRVSYNRRILYFAKHNMHYAYYDNVIDNNSHYKS